MAGSRRRVRRRRVQPPGGRWGAVRGRGRSSAAHLRLPAGRGGGGGDVGHPARALLRRRRPHDQSSLSVSVRGLSAGMGAWLRACMDEYGCK